MGKKLRTILQSDILFFTSLCIIVLVIAQLPIILHVLRAPKGFYFPYLDKVAFSDYYYPALIRFGMGKDWLLQIPYVTYPHKGSIIQIFFVLLGKLSLISHIGPFEMFALWRLIGGIVYFSSVACFFWIVLPKSARKLVFILFLCAQPLPENPMRIFFEKYEMWVWHFGEATRRISAMPPHYTLGKGLMIFTLVFFILYLRSKNKWHLILLGLSALIGGLIYPPPFFILFTSLMIALGAKVFVNVFFTGHLRTLEDYVKKNFVSLCIFYFFLLIPLVILRLELAKGYPWNLWNKVELGWNAPMMQFELHYAQQLGVLLLLVPFAIVSFMRRGRIRIFEYFIFVWCFSAFFFFPFANFLKLGKFRFTEGAQIVPLAIVAWWGIEFLKIWIPKWMGRVVLGLFLANFVLFSYLVFKDSTNALMGLYRNVYIYPDELASLRYLSSHVSSNPVILTDMYSANYIPAFAHVRAATGFPDFYEKYDDFLYTDTMTSKLFKRELTDVQAKKFITDQKAEYIYYLVYAYGKIDLYPNILQKVFENDFSALYRVK